MLAIDLLLKRARSSMPTGISGPSYASERLTVSSSAEREALRPSHRSVFRAINPHALPVRARRTLQCCEEGLPFRPRAPHSYVASERNHAGSFVEAAHRDFLSCQTSAGFQRRSCAAIARLFAPLPELVVFRLQAGRCVAQQREVGPTSYAPYLERAGSFLRRWPPHAGLPRRLSFQRFLRNRCRLAETQARLILDSRLFMDPPHPLLRHRSWGTAKGAMLKMGCLPSNFAK